MKEIAKRWWWRHLPFAPFDLQTYTTRPRNGRYWPDQDELAAWKYELVRLMHRDLHLPEYIELPAWKRARLWTHILLPDPSIKGASAMVLIGDLTPFKSWTKPEATSWNLNHSDEELTKAFLANIHSERATQKIVLKRNVNNRHRPVSWRWAEVLDLADRGVSLNANDRSKKSQATKMAKLDQETVLRVALLSEADWIASLPTVAHTLIGRFCTDMRQTFREQYLT